MHLNKPGRMVAIAMCAGLALLAALALADKFRPPPATQTCDEQIEEALATRPRGADTGDLLWKRCGTMEEAK